MNFETPAQEKSLIRSPFLWGLMAASFALSVVLAWLLNIRFDEAFTLNTTSQGFVYAFKQAIKFEQQAPLYFVVLSIWRNIDSSVFFARLFSVLCFPIFVWIAAEVGKRYVKDVNPLVFAAVAVVHQQTVWSSLDIRLYALMLVFSGLLLLFFYDGYLAEKPKTRSRIFYVIVSVLALYTQYYLGFQLVAGAAALLVLGRWRTLFRYILDMTVAGLAFLPMVFVITQQVAEVSGHTEDALSVAELVKGTYQRMTPLFLSVEWVEPEALKRWFARAAMLFIAALFCWQIFRKRRAEDITLGVMIIVLTGFFFFVYSLLGMQGIQHRHMSSLILPLLLAAFSALTVFTSKKVIYGWLALVIFLNVGFLYIAYKPLAKAGDFIRVAEYVMSNEAANQPVLVFHADAVLPLEQYYKGQNTLVALPQKTNFEVWDPRNNVLKDEKQILDIINSQPGNPERFWLAHDGWCKHGSLSFNCQVLEDVVTKYFEVESSRSFFEPVTVRLLRRRSNP